MGIKEAILMIARLGREDGPGDDCVAAAVTAVLPDGHGPSAKTWRKCRADPNGTHVEALLKPYARRGVVDCVTVQVSEADLHSSNILGDVTTLLTKGAKDVVGVIVTEPSSPAARIYTCFCSAV